MEHFTQEDVDRMIQEAAQAAKNKKGGSSDADTAKPAGAKPVSTNPVPPQQTVDPVEEVLASMNQNPPQPPPVVPEKPSDKTENTVPEPAKQPQAEVIEPENDIPQEPEPEEYEKMVTGPVADQDEDTSDTTNNEEPIEEEPIEEEITEKPVDEILEQPQEKPRPEPIKKNEVTKVHNEPEPIKSTETKIDPAFAALSSEQVYTFVMEIIKDLSEAKFQLAKMQVDLEIERLKNQALSFFKKQ